MSFEVLNDFVVKGSLKVKTSYNMERSKGEMGRIRKKRRVEERKRKMQIKGDR